MMNEALSIWSPQYALIPLFIAHWRLTNGVRRRYVYVFGFRVAGWTVT